MKLFVKQMSGRTIVLDVEPETQIVELAQMAYEKRAETQKDATLLNYAKSISFMRGGRTLAWDKKLSDYGITPESTISEIPKSFTMSPDFNWGTLSIPDPISLDEVEKPFLLNPGCLHTFEKATLKAWVQTELADHKTPDCPTCRAPIAISHVMDLMLFAPPPPSGSSSDAVASAAPSQRK